MTSSAPNVLPLWKATSGRSLTSYSWRRCWAFHSSARPGLVDRSGLTSTSGSYRFWMRPWSIGVTPISGFSVSAVPPQTKPAVSTPPLTGWPASVVPDDAAVDPLLLPPQAAATAARRAWRRAAPSGGAAHEKRATVEVGRDCRSPYPPERSFFNDGRRNSCTRVKCAQWRRRHRTATGQAPNAWRNAGNTGRRCQSTFGYEPGATSAVCYHTTSRAASPFLPSEKGLTRERNAARRSRLPGRPRHHARWIARDL